MDISDINKVASRKRVNTDAEKLKEKMSRESSKIIKLRVAQDTAYWELQERLSTVQGEHERLQQNMLDVQMQHEALSARYQSELRARPAAASRLQASRSLADLLQQHAARLRTALSRAAADRTALAASYANAARRVQDAHARHATAAAAASHAAATTADTVKQSAQLAMCAETARRHAEETLAEVRERLHDVTETARSLQARADERDARATALQAELHEAERIVTELRRDAERRERESAAAADAAARDTADLKLKLEERDAALREARQAHASLEERAHAAEEEVTRLLETSKNLETTGVDLRRELESVASTNNALREEIREKEREVLERAEQAEAARAQAEETRTTLLAERTATGEALAERADTVARLMRDVAAEAEARARGDAALHAADERARALAADLQRKEEDLAGQTRIILEMRSEKVNLVDQERLQDIIGTMQGTIDNIQKELTREVRPGAGKAAAASAARREPPEHDDDNAMQAPPAPLRQGVFRAPTPAPGARAPDDLLYHFLSDSSMDADTLDPREVNARFEALSRGAVPPATSLHALKRRAVAGAREGKGEGQGGKKGDERDVSLSQVKSGLAVARGRTFFRNKRHDKKLK